MSIWGYTVLDDDLVQEMAQEFRSWVTAVPLERAVERARGQFIDFLVDPYDVIVCELGLAEILLHEGVRSHPQFDCARSIILEGRGLEPWREKGELDLAARHAALRDLLDKIEAAEESFRRFPPPAKTPRIKGGSVVQIPLPDGTYAYAQFVGKMKDAGLLIAPLDFRSSNPLALKDLPEAPLLGNPVHCMYGFPLKEGLWQFLGNRAAPVLPPQRFVSSYKLKRGGQTMYVLTTEEGDIELGTELAEEYCNLESPSLISYDLFEERIIQAFGRRNAS